MCPAHRLFYPWSYRDMVKDDRVADPEVNEWIVPSCTRDPVTPNSTGFGPPTLYGDFSAFGPAGRRSALSGPSSNAARRSAVSAAPAASTRRALVGLTVSAASAVPIAAPVAARRPPCPKLMSLAATLVLIAVATAVGAALAAVLWVSRRHFASATYAPLLSNTRVADAADTQC